MTIPTAAGHKYFRKLPHIRVPAGIYHVRISVHPSYGRLRENWEYQITQDAILFMHKKRYMVLRFVIMPDHVHLVIQPLPTVEGLSAWCDYTAQYQLENILGSVKKFSAKKINKIRGRSGMPVWKSECFDRIARNDKDVDGMVDYVHGNPIRRGLAARPEDYRWSSASTIYSGKEEYRDWFSEG